MNDMKVLNFKVPKVKNTKQLPETEYVLMSIRGTLDLS